MRRLSRDAWLLLGLSALLIVLTVLAAISQTQELRIPPLAADSVEPDGGRALRLWLEALGYKVSAGPQGQFQIPGRAAVALVLQPTVPASAAELAQMEAWIGNGGVLILAGITSASMDIAQYFDFDLSFDPNPAAGARGQSPLLISPPQDDEAQGDFRLGWRAGQDDFLVLYAEGESPVIVSTEVGDGLLIISANALPFSNQGLQEPGNSQLALNLISAGGGPGLVWFDEWHHGLRDGSRAIAGPADWLRRAPAGRALLYAALVILVALALSGRPFGRPLTLPEQRLRRRPIEYITAVANLSRRAGHRQAVLADYRFRLKRSLGARYRLDPRLPDDEFARRLAMVDAAVDKDALFGLLARLNRPQPGEAQLLQLAQEASQWIKES